MIARDNPFRVTQLHQIRYRLLNSDWPTLFTTLFDRLVILNYRGAIIGPHGSGKTTLIETLIIELTTRNFIVRLLRLNEEKTNFPFSFYRELASTIRPDEIIILDGAEQLDYFSWQYFKFITRKAKGLIITTHNADRLPTLIECDVNKELLNNILWELLGPAANSLRDQADKLYDQHQGNLRNVLRAFYDMCANGEIMI